VTWGYAQKRIHIKGFECSSVFSTFHQFSMKRVLSASWTSASVDIPCEYLASSA